MIIHCASTIIHADFLLQLSQILTDFSEFFYWRSQHGIYNKWSLNLPPRLKLIATVPCEILISKIYLKQLIIKIYLSYMHKNEI